MTFQALDFTNYALFASISFLTMLVGLGLFLVFMTVTNSKPKRVSSLLISGLGLIAMVIFVVLSNVSSNVNKDFATANIMQKYDVKSVEWDSIKTTANPLGEIKEGEILLTANNDERYVFQYKVDEKTSEPTLLDMPIQGGNTVDKEKSAEALLKK